MKVTGKNISLVEEYIKYEFLNGGKTDIDYYITLFNYSTKNSAYASLCELRKDPSYKEYYKKLEGLKSVYDRHSSGLHLLDLDRMAKKCEAIEKENPTDDNRKLLFEIRKEIFELTQKIKFEL